MAAPGRRRLLLALLLAAASLLAAVAVAVLLHPCAVPPGDGDGAPGPNPDDGDCVLLPGICLPVSRAGMYVVDFFLGVLIGLASTSTYTRFAASDDDDDVKKAKKAGYVAIPGNDVEAGPAGGKN